MEKNPPLVSLCMPAYNAGKHIEKAIEAILAQSYPNWELIIVNDGSYDNTGALLDQLNDARITIYHQQNKGQCAAANQAFRLSRGRLIKFIDADDLISSNFLEEQVKSIGSRDDVVVSAAWGRFYNDNLSTFKLVEEKVYQNLPPHKWLLYSWEQGGAMMQCALWLIPRKILDKAGLWDESLSLINDLEFFTRVLLQSQLVIFNKNAVLFYRSGLNGSLSNTKNYKGVLSAYHSIDKATSYLLQSYAQKETALVCANVWQQFIYTFYPAFPELIKNAQDKIDLLGGSTLKYKSGGITKLLVTVFGWKVIIMFKGLLNYNK